MPYVPPALRAAAPTTAAPAYRHVPKVRSSTHSGLSGLANGGGPQETPFSNGVTFLDPETRKVRASFVWDEDAKVYRPLSPEEREQLILRNLMLRANRLGPRRREMMLADIKRFETNMSTYAYTGAADLVQTEYTKGGHSRGRPSASAGAGAGVAAAPEPETHIFHPDL